MGRFFWLLVGFAIGGGAIYGAFNFHVVKTDSGFEFVPKHAASLSDTYVDIRKFGVSDWAAHPALSADIVAAEKSQLMGQSAANPIEGEVRNLLNEIHR
jgi:hypothetical protein